MHNIYQIFAACASIQLLMFSLYLLAATKGNRAGNYFIAIILLSTSIHIFSDHFHLYYLSMVLLLTIPPTFLFYVRTRVNKVFRLEPKHLVHLIPAFFLIIVMLVQLFFFKETKIGEFGIPGTLIKVNFIYDIFTDMQFLFYTISTFSLIKIHQKNMLENYSSLSKIDLSWFKVFLIIYLIAWYFGSILFYAMHFLGIPKEVLKIYTFIDIIVIFILANYVLFKALNQPFIFNNQAREKYSGSTLSSSEKNEILKKINQIMLVEKPYLLQTISLGDLADKIAVPSKDLSQVINQVLGKNFYDFINEYRVEEAKKNIYSHRDKTFLEILYDAGFNSKAVFNNAFKKHTGMTPREYKKSTLL